MEVFCHIYKSGKSVKKRKGDHAMKYRNMMLISMETRLGMKVTGIHTLLVCILFINIYFAQLIHLWS